MLGAAVETVAGGIGLVATAAAAVYGWRAQSRSKHFEVERSTESKWGEVGLEALRTSLADARAEANRLSTELATMRVEAADARLEAAAARREAAKEIARLQAEVVRLREEVVACEAHRAETDARLDRMLARVEQLETELMRRNGP